MPEFEKAELEEKLRIANGITRKPGGRELLYDVFPTGAPFLLKLWTNSPLSAILKLASCTRVFHDISRIRRFRQ